MVATTAWLLAIFIVGIYLASLYNRFVTLRHNVRKAWSNIDVLLRQRNDELPRLIAVCKPFIRYEQDLLEAIARARSLEIAAQEAANPKRVANAETELRSSKARLLAVAERYPELKASEAFSHIEKRIAALETSIADRRTFYNETVLLNNVAVERFPGSVFARCFGFSAADSFHFAQAGNARGHRDV
jgi:LemA protein